MCKCCFPWRNGQPVHPKKKEDDTRLQVIDLTRASSNASSGSKVSGYKDGSDSVRLPKVTPYGPKEYIQPPNYFDIKKKAEELGTKQKPPEDRTSNLTTGSVRSSKTNSFKRNSKIFSNKKDFNKNSPKTFSQSDKPDMSKGPKTIKEHQPNKIYVPSRSETASKSSQDDWVLLAGKTFHNLEPADENMPSRHTNIMPQLETSNVWIKPNLYLKDLKAMSWSPPGEVSSPSLEEGLIFQGVKNKKLIPRSFKNEISILSYSKGLKELKSPSPYLSNTSVNRKIHYFQVADNTAAPLQTSLSPTFRFNTIDEERNKYLEDKLKYSTDRPVKRLLSRPLFPTNSVNNSLTMSEIEKNAGIQGKSSELSSYNAHKSSSSLSRNLITNQSTPNRYI